MLYSYKTSINSPAFIITGPEIMKIFYQSTQIPRDTFTSKCECRKTDTISISQNVKEYTVKVNEAKYRMYNVSDSDIQSIMCDAYNVLRRGPKQKVIAFSLWGNGERYVALLKGNKIRSMSFLKYRIFT